MKKITTLCILVLSSFLAFAPLAMADVIRISKSEVKSSEDYQKYAQARAENDKLHAAAKGFVSMTWYSDQKDLILGAVIIWKSEAEAKAFYDSAAYKEFYNKNIAPYVKERSTNIYQIDEVK
jgi:heme-degrading monooxygenase HmoA